MSTADSGFAQWNLQAPQPTLGRARWRQIATQLVSNGAGPMKRLIAAALALSISAAARAQEPSFRAPQKEHEWLRQFVGEWEMESECTPAPGQPPVKGRMQEKVRTIGGFWVMSEGDSEMMGQKIDIVM